MAHQEDKRRTGHGAKRGHKERSPDRDLSIEYAVIADLKPPAAKNSAPKTIEDRLVEKAAAADHRDYTGQRSLGQMSKEELRKYLFGKE